MSRDKELQDILVSHLKIKGYSVHRNVSEVIGQCTI